MTKEQDVTKLPYYIRELLKQSMQDEDAMFPIYNLIQGISGQIDNDWDDDEIEKRLRGSMARVTCERYLESIGIVNKTISVNVSDSYKTDDDRYYIRYDVVDKRKNISKPKPDHIMALERLERAVMMTNVDSSGVIARHGSESLVMVVEEVELYKKALMKNLELLK